MVESESRNMSVPAPGLQQSLFIFLALATTVVTAELLQINRFLSDVIHGRAFLYYLVLLLIVIGISLSVNFKTDSQLRPQRLFSMTVKGVFSDFLGSIVGISGAPLLTTGTLASSIGVWKKP